MRILLLGANGQLGNHLSDYLDNKFTVNSFTKNELDIANILEVKNKILSFMPHIIINCAAYTNVDSAESNVFEAYNVNSFALTSLGKISKSINAWVIHFSTDYVFDGRKRSPYLETDTPNPINIYGLSKLDGEKKILSSGTKYIIFRTSWVLGRIGENFVTKIFKNLLHNNSVNVVNDQIGVPTTTSLICEVISEVITSICKNKPWDIGIYNLTPRGVTTRYELAKMILEASKNLDYFENLKKNIIPISTVNNTSYKAARPLYTILHNSKLQQNLSFCLPNWKESFNVEMAYVLKGYK